MDYVYRWPCSAGRLRGGRTFRQIHPNDLASFRAVSICAPLWLIAWAAIIFAVPAACGEQIKIVLPTDNDALFRGGGPDFYQYVERDYKGVKSTPWEGGQYGFVRDPVDTSAGIVFSRFHEGIDIRPVRRDARGEPLDEVRAIAAGKVVHASHAAGYSNYGKYVVIEHDWDGSSYYSLYGHLSDIVVSPGATVAAGQKIGRMGHTGSGINLARSHVHLELNLMLNRQFDGWHSTFFPNEPNRHGIYNGLNLVGLDIARLYLALQKNPGMTVANFVRSEPAFYTVAIPRSAHFELPKRYPWLLAKEPGPSTQSWLVSFAASGLPVKIEPSPNAVSQPQIMWVKKTSVDCRYLTRGDVTGRGSSARLTDAGKRLMRLLIFPD
ncbi:MAG TPA: M23 family metallopeptidase [Chthoniobacterales bacterium]|nr:M23 family metallopeptidase [Chthoniobacterales bacterium]